MFLLSFNEDDLSTLVNAVRVAKERYQQNAKLAREHAKIVLPVWHGQAGTCESIAAQFDKQVNECDVLLAKFEDAEAL